MTAGPFTPTIRGYTQASSLESTDAFELDRLDVGTMYIEARDLGAALAVPRCLTYVIDGGGAAISTGVAGDLYLPFAVTLVSATLLADQNGSVVVDIWADALSAYPPTDADSITAGAPPTIAASDHAQDATLTGWTTRLPAGTTLRFNVDSISAITRLTIALATG